MKVTIFFIGGLLSLTLLLGCGPKRDVGVGPIKNISLDEIQLPLVNQGKMLYNSKCTMCHSIDQKLVGPALGDVTKRREPEWIMNMMLNPDGMVKENEAAKLLLKEYNNVPMINQHLSEKEARAILEYLRSIESK